MKTKTIEVSVFTCDTCGATHTSDAEIRPCDVCKSTEICSRCRSSVDNVIDNTNTIALFQSKGVYAVCEECRKMIAGKVDDIKNDLVSWIEDLKAEEESGE